MADWDYRPEEEQEEKKPKKYVTRKEFYLCFMILLGALAFATFAVEDRINQAQNHVANQVYQTEERISSTINSIPRNIEQGIEDANNPIRESSMEIVDVDYEKETVMLRMTASPKEYQNGITVHFFVTCDDGEPVKVDAAAKADRTFAAECEVPYCDRAEVKAVLKKGNTEYLKLVGSESINSQVLPDAHGFFGGSTSFGASVHRFNRMVEFRIYAPNWMTREGDFLLKNVTAVVEIDGKTVMTAPMEEIERDYDCATYTVELEEFKLKAGEKLKVYCTAEDNNGKKYIYIVEQGEALKNDYISEEPAMSTDGTDPRLTIE
ncbi:MAG: hypothetical protein IJY52_06535 [Anaerotignum sp.]|nr:hypothetical protein [Anaerotignum sp.]